MENVRPNPPIFRLGIVMAGAVSAGAYTAGVMDYLLETLQHWEEAKRRNLRILEACGHNLEKAKHEGFDPSVPPHRVVIEVMAGASAGGMTAAVTAMSLLEGIPPFREGEDNAANRLYTSWVNLNDNAENVTFRQMLDTTDIEKEGLKSLLNSDPIDKIADRLHEVQIKKRLEDYGYLSPNMNLVLTLCSLRGIPIDISFNTKTAEPEPPQNEELEVVFVPKNEQRSTPVAHRMFLHKGVGQFCFAAEGQKTPPHVLRIDPAVQKQRQMLINAAKATGAFPIGLKFRKLQIPDASYIKAQVQRLFGIGDSGTFKINVEEGKPFEFVAVDGGAINNEPIGETDNIMEELFAADCANNTASPECKNFGVIMIDPFPDFDSTDSAQPIETLEQVPAKLLGAIRRQAMLKEGDIRQGFKGVDYTRGLIFPQKKNANGQGFKKTAIACGSLGGFGGFLSREFREHDFRLGRKNCQSFLRKYFAVKEDDNYDVLGRWTPEMKQRFSIIYEGDENTYLPIIPDTHMLEGANDPSKLQAPPDVAMSAAEVCAYYPGLRRRTEQIIKHFFNPPRSIYGRKRKVAAGPPNMDKQIHQMITRHTGSLFSKIAWLAIIALTIVILLPVLPVLLLLTVLPLLYIILVKIVAARVVRRTVLKTILQDLKDKELLRV
ncbi:MAG: hypothetical protein EPO28_01240 [Saprospiraceae bacterium]|nr:MAG: hypothetical protein EPO28_01240 [Saprospiraceae bacterium]